MDDFKIISAITKNSFLDKWTDAEQYNSNNGRHDPNSLDRINAFRDLNLKVDLIEISPDKSLDKFLVPYHAGQDHFFKTSSGGNTLKEFTDSYSFNQVLQNEHDTCSKSLKYHLDTFKAQKDRGQLFVESTCMYCTHNPALSPDKNSRPGQFLYSGGFHQIAAYGLFIKHFVPISLRLYLCNNAPYLFLV